MWCTDGTQGGTTMIIQYTNGFTSESYPLGYHNSVYFPANDPTHGEGLWAADQNGVPAFIKNINWPHSFFIFNDKLNFFDRNGIFMMSDGTSLGTHPWQDNTNATFQPISSFQIFQNKVYFFDMNHSFCSFDGVIVTKIKKFPAPPVPTSMIAGCGDKIFFCIKNSVSSTFDLWWSNGTPDGTTFYKSLYNPSPNTYGFLGYLIEGDKLGFLTRNDTNTGSDFWVIDANNNYSIKKAFPNSFQAFFNLKAVSINNTIFAFCNYNNSGFRLYKLTL